MIINLAMVTHTFDQPIRYVNQAASGGSYVAILTLRLTPARSISGVEFATAISRPELEPWILSAIEKGVRMFIEEREEERKPIGQLLVTLVDIDIHPIDSRELAFSIAAYRAMKQAFKENEVIVDVAG
jgi:elongation factor G